MMSRWMEIVIASILSVCVAISLGFLIHDDELSTLNVIGGAGMVIGVGWAWQRALWGDLTRPAEDLANIAIKRCDEAQGITPVEEPTEGATAVQPKNPHAPAVNTSQAMSTFSKRLTGNLTADADLTAELLLTSRHTTTAEP
jgi:hypothetical protein